MSYYNEDELKRFSDITKHRPHLFEKFMAWYQACQEDGSVVAGLIAAGAYLIVARLTS